MIADPPFDAGADQETPACMSPAVATTFVGAPGAISPAVGVTVYATARIVPRCAALQVSDTDSAAPVDDDSANATNARFGLPT